MRTFLTSALSIALPLAALAAPSLVDVRVYPPGIRKARHADLRGDGR